MDSDCLGPRRFGRAARRGAGMVPGRRTEVAAMRTLRAYQSPAGSLLGRVCPCFRRQKAPCSANHERSMFNTYFADKKRFIGDEREEISNPAGMFWKFLPAVRD